MQELNNQAQDIEQLKEDILGMMDQVLSQLEKAKTALEESDTNIANEILALEKKVNATDISIVKSCENILALYAPVASDLRFVMAVLNISNQLERIGDHAEGIAEYIIDEEINIKFSKKILEGVRFYEMFEIALSMVSDAIYGFTKEDTEILKWVFGKDKTLNKINKKIPEIISENTKKKPEPLKQNLYLFSIMKKLERVGDLAKNIAEETIFYLDAKIIKHKRARKYKEFKKPND
ncbi:MAG: phosphate signaling complex protein PhoU [Saprospiraceae bacterium]|nr:phosphate signaling complex protein PhoU [Bacteroidia bacterium]NNF22835.1 phosphate signaling complex protein PhoU [Saprospiraceae bacterium]NNK89307.1 phosphate signaling complex protein PhoU [Saprospiraceae bacterium]